MRPGSLPLSLALIAALLLTACGPAQGDQTDPTTADAPPVGENCGREVAVDRPPERVVTMNQHATELLLALDLGDRVVGTAFLDDDIHPDLADAYAAVPVLADTYPSKEEVLGADPDLVFAGFVSAFADDAAGSRSDLEELGIATHLSTEFTALLAPLFTAMALRKHTQEVMEASETIDDDYAQAEGGDTSTEPGHRDDGQDDSS